MEKMDMVHEIRAAKRAHVSWVSHAHALIMGLPLEKKQVPLHGTECKFGQWYYGHGQILHGIAAFKAIEQPHISLHETYMKIFQLLFGEHKEEKQSFWQKMFGKSAEVDDSEENKKEADQHYGVLKGYSEQVVKLLDALEDELDSMDDTRFAGLAANA